MTGIEGLWAAMATPLDEAGDVDLEAFAGHARWLLDQDCDGVVAFGTTGEGTSFSPAERLDAIEALLDAGIEPDQIALGTGHPAVTETIALTKAALGLGLRHALILPPYFYRDVDAQGIEEAFAAIIEGVDDDRLLATLYHIPQVSGVAVPPAVLARLRTRFGAVLAGVKDSSGNFAEFQAFRAAAPEVAVTIGNEADIGRALTEGGTGTICGMANLAPGLVRATFHGHAAEATMRAALAVMQDPFVPTLKAALADLTGTPGWARTRAPLRPARAGVGRRVADGLRRLQAREAAGS